MSQREHQQNLLGQLEEKRRLESQVNDELDRLKTSYENTMPRVRNSLPQEFANRISSEFGEIVWNPTRVQPGINFSQLMSGSSIAEQIRVLEQDTIIEARASNFVTRHVDQNQSDIRVNLQMSLRSETYDVTTALNAIKDAEDIHQLIAALQECTRAFDALTKALTLES